MIIDKKEYEVLKKVSEITLTDYNIKWFDKENIEGYIDSYSLFSMVEDMLGEVEKLSDDISDLERDIEDNYRPIPLSEQYEISDREFI